MCTEASQHETAFAQEDFYLLPVRTILSLAAVFIASLGLVGTVVAEGSDSQRDGKAERSPLREQGKPDRDQKNRVIHGYVISTAEKSFKLDLRQVETNTGDDVSVLVTGETQFRVPGGKLTTGILSGPQKLLAGDQVLVRGHWTERAELEFTAEVVALTGKTLKRFGGSVTAVSSDSITVRREKDDETITKTFSLSGAVKLPADATLAVGDRVLVLYRVDTTTALAVVDRAALRESLKDARAERQKDKRDKKDKDD
jgi:hypothetical protein